MEVEQLFETLVTVYNATHYHDVEGYTFYVARLSFLSKSKSRNVMQLITYLPEFRFTSRHHSHVAQ
jgi:hypothetical protein